VSSSSFKIHYSLFPNGGKRWEFRVHAGSIRANKGAETRDTGILPVSLPSASM